MYANPLSKGSVINRLDVATLPALEVDTDLNVNVMTGSDGVIRGASGWSGYSLVSKMSMVISPLVTWTHPYICRISKYRGLLLRASGTWLLLKSGHCNQP